MKLAAASAAAPWIVTVATAVGGRAAAGGFAASVTRPSIRASPASASSETSAPTPGASRASKARQDFEAFVLQAMLGAMMPEGSSKLFGTGPAGKIWQSMLSEQMAGQIAASGRLRLLGDRLDATAGAASAAGIASPGTPSATAGWRTRIEMETADEP